MQVDVATLDLGSPNRSDLVHQLGKAQAQPFAPILVIAAAALSLHRRMRGLHLMQRQADRRRVPVRRSLPPLHAHAAQRLEEDHGAAHICRELCQRVLNALLPARHLADLAGSGVCLCAQRHAEQCAGVRASRDAPAREVPHTELVGKAGGEVLRHVAVLPPDSCLAPRKMAPGRVPHAHSVATERHGDVCEQVAAEQAASVVACGPAQAVRRARALQLAQLLRAQLQAWQRHTQRGPLEVRQPRVQQALLLVLPVVQPHIHRLAATSIRKLGDVVQHVHLGLVLLGEQL
mmetsp:Transcript_16115/g.40412  ORF Transcript_16115/g.40412 Transcript_16115/m.40412 type:complete len:290 (+) Transcript_16115:4302-5171(+)